MVQGPLSGRVQLGLSAHQAVMVTLKSSSSVASQCLPGPLCLQGRCCFPSASQRSAPRGSGLPPPPPPLLRHTRTGSLPESRALTTTCQRADSALHTSPERQTFQGCFLLHVSSRKCRWLVTCNVKTPGVAPCSPQAASGAPSPVCPSRIPSSHLEALQLSLTPGHPRHDHGVS